MKTIEAISSRRRGSLSKASARFVCGPMATMVTSPGCAAHEVNDQVDSVRSTRLVGQLGQGNPPWTPALAGVGLDQGLRQAASHARAHSNGDRDVLAPGCAQDGCGAAGPERGRTISEYGRHAEKVQFGMLDREHQRERIVGVRPGDPDRRIGVENDLSSSDVRSFQSPRCVRCSVRRCRRRREMCRQPTWPRS